LSYFDWIGPVWDLLYVRDDEISRELGSGLIMPESAKTTIETGTIIKVGPDAPEGFAAGQRIVFRPYAGVPVTLESDLDGSRMIRAMSPGDVKCILAAREAA
jgi:co-chaperonin GroES (HSP10)